MTYEYDFEMVKRAISAYARFTISKSYSYVIGGSLQLQVIRVTSLFQRAGSSLSESSYVIDKMARSG